MAEAKSPRTAKPGTLLSQWWTLGAIACDKRTTGRHVKVAWVIVDRYMQKHGAGRASLRYIEKATGLDRKAVIRACRELAHMGYVTQRLGSGTRPSEYMPTWATCHPSGVQMTTAKPDNPSGVEMTTGVVVESTPLETASGVQMTTESFLHEPADKPASWKEDIDCAAPSAPDAAALSGASPGTAQEVGEPTFESLWRAYAHNRAKKEARAAWNALPAEVDRGAVIAAAIAWQESWAAQGKPDAPRFTLARWLRDERYDEDAPRGFQKVERAGKAKAKPGNHKPASQPEPITVRIVSAKLSEADGITALNFTAADAAGTVTSHSIIIEHPHEETQVSGQKHMAKLVHAAGLDTISETSELHGRSIVITHDERIFCTPDRRPDDEPPLPVRPEPVKYANPSGAASEPHVDFGTDEWQRRKTEQYRRDAAVREWDKEHPELFQDDDEAPVEHSGEPIKIDFETWRQHAGLSVDEAEAVLTGEGE